MNVGSLNRQRVLYMWSCEVVDSFVFFIINYFLEDKSFAKRS